MRNPSPMFARRAARLASLLTVPVGVLSASGAAFAATTILEPAPTTVSIDGQSIKLQDVYAVDDIITVRTSTAATCTFYDGNNTAVATFNTASTSGGYAYNYRVRSTDAPGDWDVTCAGVTQPFVVDAAHNQLWLDRGIQGIVDDYVAAGGAKSTWYNQANPPAVGSVSPYWVDADGWYYLENIANPNYTQAFATKIPNASGATNKYATTEPWESLYSGGGLATAASLHRLALAADMANDYVNDPTLAADPIEANADDYQKAAIYWGNYLASIPDWSNPVLPNAYKDSTGKIVYCGTGSCYTKDTYGAKVAWTGSSKTQLTANLDDLARGQLLIALASAYDWLHDDLDPATRREWRDKLVEETVRYMGDETVPRNWAGYMPNARKSVQTNNHIWMHHAAVGVVAYVLWDEMGTQASTRDQWLSIVDNAYKEFYTGLANDGASHEGVGYWQYGLTYLLAYVDAKRTIGGDSSLYNTNWLKNTPEYLLHDTLPNGQRANIADGEYSDRGTVAGLVGRLASQYHNPLAQRLAWQGHNVWSYPDHTTRRDYMDILWFDEGISPDMSLATQDTDRCFGDLGLVDVRTGWGDGDTDLLFRGGPMIGIHDHPDVGSFVLYSNGHLVTDDGADLTAKRTAVHSTMLVDGKGQHGDGNAFIQFPPEGPGNNNSQLTAFLDNGGSATGFSDIATFSTDITQLYRYDSTDTPYDGATQTDTSTKKLTELSRNMVWLGDAVLVLDRFAGTGAFKIDWNLETGKDVDTNSDGLEDGTFPTSCPIAKASTSGYYVYKDYTGKETDVRLGSNKIATCVSGSCTSSTNYTSLNTNVYAPQRDTSSATVCGDNVGNAGTTATVNAPSTVGGKLDIQSLDLLTTSKFDKQASVSDVGNAIMGYHLNKHQTASAGMFLTALFPHLQTDSALASASSKAVTGGAQIDVNLPLSQKATVLFATPGQSSVSGSGVVKGTLGVIGRDALGGVRVAQMVSATDLQWGGKSLISASAPVNVGMTFEADSAWGAVQLPSGVAKADVSVNLPGILPAAIKQVQLDGVNVSWMRTATGIVATIPHSGRLTIRTVLGQVVQSAAVCQ